MKVSIIVPVFNEEETIEEIIARLRAVSLEQELILVNDASSDASGSIMNTLAQDGSIKVLHHPVNRGKGAAIATGLAHASGDVAVIQDADLEYNPQDFVPMLALLQKKQVDVVYGVRNLSSQRFVMRWGNRFLSWLTSLLYGRTVSDMETCYKMLSRKVYQGLKLECRRFDVEAELTAKILKGNFSFAEYPIQYIARYENKKLSPLDGLPALKALIKYRFQN
jgi:glycosyltransferase involved in cell wall biosynthesis